MRLSRKPKSFKENYSFESRLEESTRIMAKYPDRVPVIIEKSNDTDIPDIDRKKFLVPNDVQLSQLMYIIRKRIKIAPEKSIYLFINSKLINGSLFMASIYENCTDKDGFLYVTYAGENTFG